MLRKILKWTSIVLGGLVGLLLLAFAALYIMGTLKWNRLHGQYAVPVETIPIPTNEASIERGEHIATIRMCRQCHMDDLGGQTARAPGLITLAAQNAKGGVAVSD